MTNDRRINYHRYGNSPGRRRSGRPGGERFRRTRVVGRKYVSTRRRTGSAYRKRGGAWRRRYYPPRVSGICQPSAADQAEPEQALTGYGYEGSDREYQGTDVQEGLEYGEESGEAGSWEYGEEYSEAGSWEYGEENCQEDKPKKEHGRKRRRGVKVAVWILAACLAVLLLFGGFAYYRLPYRCVKDAVTIEAGQRCPSVSEFLQWECEQAYIVSGISEDMEFTNVQDYRVVIHLYHQDVETTLHVVDTVPPEIQTRNREIVLGEEFELWDFVKSISDVTAYRVSYREKPEISAAGEYTVTLQVEDEGGNVTAAPARLKVIEDVTPPVIAGVEQLIITVGENVSYKRNVTVTDDHDDDAKLEVDTSQVDLDTPGDYIVVYRATDKFGNVAEVSTVLHVKALPVESTMPMVRGIPVTEEAVNAEADKLLASITTPTMSQYEVLRAIYNWCHSKIAYAEGTPKGNWVEGAYCGIVKGRGDCYAYAMSAKCLLLRAGITNMDIERVPTETGMHFWNLVDIGEGWHHFDTCRRADGSTFFYLTDAELMAYSETHTARDYPNGSHYYDRTLYPQIP